MLFQADTGFYFRIAGGYINASLTPVNALPHAVTLLAHPSAAAIRTFDRYARSSGLARSSWSRRGRRRGWTWASLACAAPRRAV